LQVRIKKKQPLVKKDLEPVVTEDDMKNASQTDGAFLAIIFYILFCQLKHLPNLKKENIVNFYIVLQ
jgi:hypothetical protein